MRKVNISPQAVNVFSAVYILNILHTVRTISLSRLRISVLENCRASHVYVMCLNSSTVLVSEPAALHITESTNLGFTTRDVMKFAFDNVQTLNIFSRLEIWRKF